MLAIGEGGGDPSLDLSIHEREWKRCLKTKIKNINRPHRVLFEIENKRSGKHAHIVFFSQDSVKTTGFIIDKSKANWSEGLTAWQIPPVAYIDLVWAHITKVYLMKISLSRSCCE